MEPRREAESHELSAPRPLGAAATSTSCEPSPGHCPSHLPLCVARAKSSQGTASLGLPLKPWGQRWGGGGVLPECPPQHSSQRGLCRDGAKARASPWLPCPRVCPACLAPTQQQQSWRHTQGSSFSLAWFPLVLSQLGRASPRSRKAPRKGTNIHRWLRAGPGLVVAVPGSRVLLFAAFSEQRTALSGSQGRGKPTLQPLTPGS